MKRTNLLTKIALSMIMVIMFTCTGCTLIEEINIEIPKNTTISEKDEPKQENEKQTNENEIKIEEKPENVSIIEEKNQEMDLSVYDKTLQNFYNNIINVDIEKLYEEEELISLAEAYKYKDTNSILQTYGYTYKDINNDGIIELIIGNVQETYNGKSYGDIIWNLYTYVEGEVVCLINGYTRNIYRLFEDGAIHNSGVGGAIYYCSTIYDLPINGNKLVCLDNYFTHEKDEDVENLVVYYNTNGSWDPNQSEETNKTLEEFFEWDETNINSTITFEITPFTKYKNAKPLDLFNFANDKLEKDDFCAVGYLGYYDEDDDIMSYLKHKKYFSNYPFLSDIDEEHIILGEGYEWYLLIPTKDNSIITISETIINEKDYAIEKGKTLYTFNDNKPILVRCNVSEIIPEFFINIKTKNENISFSPSLSMKDGSLQQNDCILDITNYEMIEGMALKVINDVENVEYKYYKNKTFEVSTPNQAQIEVDPILFTCLKNDMIINVELIEWTEDGLYEIIDLIDVLYLSKGDTFYLNTILQTDTPAIRLTARYIENDIEKEAIWFCAFDQVDPTNIFYVSGI